MARIKKPVINEVSLQPIFVKKYWPIGKATKPPKEPVAPTTPRTQERFAAGNLFATAGIIKDCPDPARPIPVKTPVLR